MIKAIVLLFVVDYPSTCWVLVAIVIISLHIPGAVVNAGCGRGIEFT